jgi:hypothetical protein
MSDQHITINLTDLEATHTRCDECSEISGAETYTVGLCTEDHAALRAFRSVVAARQAVLAPRADRIAEEVARVEALQRLADLDTPGGLAALTDLLSTALATEVAEFPQYDDYLERHVRGITKFTADSIGKGGLSFRAGDLAFVVGESVAWSWRRAVAVAHDSTNARLVVPIRFSGPNHCAAATVGEGVVP